MPWRSHRVFPRERALIKNWGCLLSGCAKLSAKFWGLPRHPRHLYSRAYHAEKAQALREGATAEEAALRAQMAGKAAAAAAED